MHQEPQPKLETQRADQSSSQSLAKNQKIQETIPQPQWVIDILSSQEFNDFKLFKKKYLHSEYKANFKLLVSDFRKLKQDRRQKVIKKISKYLINLSGMNSDEKFIGGIGLYKDFLAKLKENQDQVKKIKYVSQNQQRTTGSKKMIKNLKMGAVSIRPSKNFQVQSSSYSTNIGSEAIGKKLKLGFSFLQQLFSCAIPSILWSNSAEDATKTKEDSKYEQKENQDKQEAQNLLKKTHTE